MRKGHLRSHYPGATSIKFWCIFSNVFVSFYKIGLIEAILFVASLFM